MQQRREALDRVSTCRSMLTQVRRLLSESCSGVGVPSIQRSGLCTVKRHRSGFGARPGPVNQWGSEGHAGCPRPVLCDRSRADCLGLASAAGDGGPGDPAGGGLIGRPHGGVY